MKLKQQHIHQENESSYRSRIIVLTRAADAQSCARQDNKPVYCSRGAFISIKSRYMFYMRAIVSVRHTHNLRQRAVPVCARALANDVSLSFRLSGPRQANSACKKSPGRGRQQAGEKRRQLTKLHALDAGVEAELVLFFSARDFRDGDSEHRDSERKISPLETNNKHA